jgi:cold shock protein
MVTRGVVKFFKPEKGWGAISCDELADGQDVWVHFSSIEALDYRALEAGDVVDFDYEAVRQDSFNFRATRARRLESGPAPVLRRAGARVEIATVDTPDTPLTAKRQGGAD